MRGLAQQPYHKYGTDPEYAVFHGSLVSTVFGDVVGLVDLFGGLLEEEHVEEEVADVGADAVRGHFREKRYDVEVDVADDAVNELEEVAVRGHFREKRPDLEVNELEGVVRGDNHEEHQDATRHSNRQEDAEQSQLLEDGEEDCEEHCDRHQVAGLEEGVDDVADHGDVLDRGRGHVVILGGVGGGYFYNMS